MARKARFCQPGIPVLLHQSTTAGFRIIQDQTDLEQMQRFVADNIKRLNCQLHAYGFVANQLWLVLTPGQSDTVQKLMQSLGRRYSAHFFKRYPQHSEDRGYLWGQRYRCIPMEPERYLIQAMCYVENRVAQTIDGQPDKPAIASSSRFRPDNQGLMLPVTPPVQYLKLAESVSKRQVEYRSLCYKLAGGRCEKLINSAISSQSGLGSRGFLRALEAVSGIRLRPGKPGRPKKYH